MSRKVTRYTDKLIEIVCKEVVAGVDYKKVANKYGIPAGTVYGWTTEGQPRCRIKGAPKKQPQQLALPVIDNGMHVKLGDINLQLAVIDEKLDRLIAMFEPDTTDSAQDFKND